MADLIQRLERFEEGMPAEKPSAAVEKGLLELAERVESLTALRKKIEIDTLEAEAERLLRGNDEPDWTTQTECLLAMPLLRAEIRLKLLDRLLDPMRVKDAKGAAVGRSRFEAWDRKRWNAVVRQAELEVRLARLADASVALEFDEAAASSQDDERRWTALRTLGARLNAFYEGLPNPLRESLDAADPARARRAAPADLPRRCARRPR